MERLIYRNALGQEIEFSLFSPYILRTIREATKNNLVTTTNSSMDGHLYESSTLDIRDIKVKATIVNTSDDVRRRLTRNLLTIINPKQEGTLIYRTDEDEKEIRVRLDEIPDPVRNKGTTDIDLDFVALNPYWQNKDKTEYLAFLTPKFHFPLVIPINKGIVFGLRRSILETPVQNIGDVPAGFRVVFKAKGYVKNPEIEHKYTGEKLKVLVEMQKGDILDIINTTQRKMVFFNGEKAFKYLDRNNADFFVLEVGQNLIGYGAEVNAVNMDVIMYYSPLFLGRE